MNNKIAVIFLVSLVIIVIVFYFKKEKFEGCEKNSGVNDMPESAAEACKRISTRAEEIEAHYKGAANIAANIPIVSWMNPNNYSAGDNTSTDIARNIVNTNLSKCEVEKIHASCSNIAGGTQSNIIDTSKCYFCTHIDPSKCIVSGNVQINESKGVQTCSMKLAIKSLSEKTGSVDAQALAKVIQKAEGILSGNTESNVENCNIISRDLSSKTYLEKRSECINNINLDQENLLDGCAFIDNVQKNLSDQIQSCYVGTEIEKTDVVEDTVDVSREIVTEQTSRGIDQAAMIASAASCSSSVILAGVVLYYVGMEEL